jgi:hypothetical protein
MFRISSVVALVCCQLGAVVLQPANAQSSLPRGTYEQTCVNSYVSGNVLYSLCKNRSGYYNQQTQIVNFRECRGDIYNIDGFVTCTKGTAEEPRGSYRETCRDIVIRNNFMYATCKTKSGRWISTSLQNFAGWRGDIVNIDGTLALR